MTEPSFAGSGPSTPQDPLAPLLARLASLQGHAVPWHRFAMMSEGSDGTPLAGLTAATRARELWQARFPAGEVRTVEWPATAADVPALWIGPEGQSAGEQHYVVQGVLSSGALSCLDGSGQTIELPAAQARAGQLLQLLADATARAGQAGQEPARSATDWFKHAIARRRSVFVDGMVATLTVNAIGLTTSFYSMQVYDRVLPTMGYATLWVLTLGMGLAILLELLMRHLRARQIERGCKAIDEELSSVFFGQALAIRMDQRPATVGTFAAQIRQFEMVRNFLTSSTMFVLADAPFALLFVGVLALIAGPLALVPLALIPLSLLTGLAFSRSLARRSEEHVADSNRKNGLLIEAIDGIESVKAAGAEWKLLQRWRALTRTLADNETAIKDLTNLSSNLTQTLQQLGYVGLIVAGTYAIGAGQLTMGGMIACTIISGRALGPIAQIAGLVVQWQQARVALKGLDQIMALPADSQSQERRLVPDHCEGRLRLEQLRHGYGEDVPALEIERLSFGPGERVAVLGAVGSGKSTLIKVLSGLYRPAAGRAFLDDVDMAQLAPDFMREQIGYLPQDVRLFQGSLRENLALGLPSPTDAQILAAARQTGLDRLIAAHPRGLGLQISEGGRGLSGGQRQLAGLTRLVLARPRVLLLDEPTAAMDPRLEEFVAERVFAQSPADATLVVVTHKPALLRHFNRIVVLERGRVLADGPRDEVLRRLQAAAAQAAVPAHPPRPLTSNPATT